MLNSLIIEDFKNNETMTEVQMFQLLKEAECLCSGDRLIHKLCDICDIQPININKHIEFHFDKVNPFTFGKTVEYIHKNSDLKVIEEQLDVDSRYDMFEHKVIKG